MSNREKFYTPERRELILQTIDESGKYDFTSEVLPVSAAVDLVLMTTDYGYTAAAIPTGLYFWRKVGESRDVGLLMHRNLLVEKTLTENLSQGTLASILLNHLDFITQIRRVEVVQGYDLIRFYIRRGYVPFKRSISVSRKDSSSNVDAFLANSYSADGLLEALKSNEEPPDRYALPYTMLELNPKKAEEWQEALGLNSYPIPEGVIETAGFAPDPRL